AVAAGADADAETIESMRHAMGLDRPILIQFWDYFSGLLQGDFGDSLVQDRPVLDIIWERVPATASLVACALIIAMLISIPLGVCAAVFRDTVIDRLSVLFGSLGVALPDFFVGLLLVLVFAIHFGWF